MKIFIEQEHGYPNQVWEYPGSIEELIADYRVGRAPSGVEYDDSMPPMPKPRVGQGYLGTLTPAESTDRRHTVGIMYTQDDRCTLWIKGRSEPIIPDLHEAPIGTPEAFERVKKCPSAQSLTDHKIGNSTPRSHAWVTVHLRLCKNCSAK